MMNAATQTKARTPTTQSGGCGGCGGCPARPACLPAQVALRVWLTRDDAVMPCKAHPSDVGYNLTLVARHKTLVGVDRVVMYDTGVRASPPPGYYVEVVPRSSLSKTGWMLANSVGVIDPSYTGNIYVAVARIEPDAPELSMPFRGFQMILRPSPPPTSASS